MKEEISYKIEGNEWEKLQDEAFLKLNKKANIDGFRPGKAPKEVYIKKYGTKDILFDAADIAVKQEYERIIKEEKIIPIIEPKIDLVECNEEKLVVKFIFVVDPKVTLGKYKNLGVKHAKIKVTKEEIKNKIDSLLDQYAEVVPKDGKIENGDTAIIDFKGLKDGVEFEGGSAENYSLKIGSKTFIPGFEEALIGANAGDKLTIPLTFPKDYVSEELKGQKVVFEVKVNEVKMRVVPKLDKDFFDDLAMDGVNSKETLEEEVKHELTHQKEHDAMHKFENDCLDKATEGMKIEICDEFIDDEVNYMYNEFTENLKRQGIEIDLYLKYSKLTEETIKKDLREEAIKRIKRRYLFKEVVKVEKIEATEEETKTKLKEMQNVYNMREEDILKEVSLDEIKMNLVFEKAFQIISSNEEEAK